MKLFKKKKQTFDTTTLRFNCGVGMFDVDVKVPIELLEKIGDSKQWSRLVKESVTHYIRYLLEEKQMSDYEFNNFFDKIVIENFDGSIPVQ